MAVVHISTDYPDPIVPGKTSAISNLVNLTTGQLDHFVYSLNRTPPPISRLMRGIAGSPFRPVLPIRAGPSSDALQSLVYEAPPKGIYLHALLERVADWIASDLERRSIRPELIHGHKLTMEGLVAARVAARLNVAYGLSLQGNTDRAILSFRRDLVAHYRRVFHGAAIVFPFTPWILDFTEARLGRRRGPTIVLPCVTPADRIIAPRLVGPKLISVFRLAQQRLKNVEALVAASKRLEREIPDYRLEIVGDGPDGDRAKLERLIARAGASSVRLAGAVPHEHIQEKMNRSSALALVSHRETFGMVFVEALLAGCPILYPAGGAVSGFFDGCPFAVAASPGRQSEVEEGMRRLVRDEPSVKRSLAEWQATSAPHQFQRNAVAAAYVRGVHLAAPLPSHPIESGILTEPVC